MTSHAHSTALVWLRRDLRLADNPALSYARENAARVIPVYIHDEDSRTAGWGEGAASRWWLHHSLESLQQHIGRLGGKLIFRHGSALKELRALIEETRATLVTWNRLYEPLAIERDKRVKAALRKDALVVESFNGSVLLEPWAVQTGAGTPYRVFTPFWRACAAKLENLPGPLAAPASLAPAPRGVRSDPLDSLDLLPDIRWDEGLKAAWTPGERAARKRLTKFTEEVARYPDTRNLPDRQGTSRLSPHLHFGEISPRQIANALRAQPAAAFVRQLVWRDFAHHLLFHFPHTSDQPLDPRFRHFSWRRSRVDLKAWQRGRTGYPFVDAGMRELWHTGWMHNRVRMCVASFLTKNLRLHWLAGARWFWDTLVDADLANNTLGWQWTAGCGADAAPYFRVFNPVLQAERFDPARTYIRHWVPELKEMPDRWIHRPWEAPAAVLQEARVKLGRDYPQPIVDLQESRVEALQAYRRSR